VLRHWDDQDQAGCVGSPHDFVLGTKHSRIVVVECMCPSLVEVMSIEIRADPELVLAMVEDVFWLAWILLQISI
jgi:hypothetical protein